MIAEEVCCRDCNKYWYAEGSECKDTCEKYKNEKMINSSFSAKLDNLIGICINSYIDTEGNDDKAIEAIRFTFKFLQNELGG